MEKEEIALRLVEAWVGQEGNPVNIYSVLQNYEYILKELETNNTKI